MNDIIAIDSKEIAQEISKLLKISGPLKSVSPEKAKTAEYQEAVTAYDNALRETIRYMQRIKSANKPVDENQEFRLSQLWSNASIAISNFDPLLANRCFIKGQGWLNPAVWNDARYKNYRIGIDDMREALMEFQDDQFAKRNSHVPSWFPIAGYSFAIATFISLFYLLLAPDLTSQKKVIFNVWIAFCVAASAAFIGGSAAASGSLTLPLFKNAPVKFSTVGGIAVFIVVLILMTLVNS